MDALNGLWKVLPFILVSWTFVYSWSMKLAAPTLIGSRIKFGSAFLASFLGIVLPVVLVFLVLRPHFEIMETELRGPVQAAIFVTIYLVGAAINRFVVRRESGAQITFVDACKLQGVVTVVGLVLRFAMWKAGLTPAFMWS